MNNALRNRACALALLAPLWLVACGGGSDDDATSPDKPVVSEEALRLRRMGAPATPSGAVAADEAALVVGAAASAATP